MTARILDGKSIALQIRKEIAIEVAALLEHRGIQPCLAAVLVGDDPASQVYVRNKEIACEKAGIQSRLYRLPSGTTTTELLEVLTQLNSDAKIHGILVQLPLPMQIHERQVLDAVLPAKDVDAFAPENVGLISQGRPRYLQNFYNLSIFIYQYRHDSYRLVYEIERETTVWVLALVHTAKQWPPVRK